MARRAWFVAQLVAVVALGACRALAGYAAAHEDAGLADRGSRDGRGREVGAPPDLLDDTASDGRSDGPLEAAALDAAPDTAPAAHVVLVNDDWAGTAVGKEIAPGLLFGSNAFATIKSALTATSASVTEIEVRPGIYDEQVKITREKLVLRGVGRPLLRKHDAKGQPAGVYVVSIEASNVTVRGFEIDAGGNGIEVYCAAQAFTNVLIRDNFVHGMCNVGGDMGVGILVWGACTKIMVRENVVHDNDRQGIYLGSTNPVVIASDCTIRDNTIYDNGRYTVGGLPDPSPYGIQVHGALRTLVQGNAIRGQYLTYTGFGKLGAAIWVTGADNRILDNDLSQSHQGIYAGSVTNLIARGNTIHDTTTGLLLTAWLGNAVLDGNMFCRNTLAVHNQATTKASARGCWWADPLGPNVSGEKTQGPLDVTGHLTTAPASGPCAP